MTNCPTCGAKVRVVGKTTMHYEPIDSEIPNDWEKEFDDEYRWLDSSGDISYSVVDDVMEFISDALDKRTEDILKELCPSLLSEDYDCTRCNVEENCNWQRYNIIKAKFLRS